MTAHVQWRIAPQDRAATGELARALGAPRVVAQLLLTRGVSTPEAARAFLNPLDAALSDPFELSDMDRAVHRLKRARDAREHVRVFGDYDVDGMSGTALLKRGFERFGIEACSWAIPSRLTDGYGLSPRHIDQAKASGVSLIVTVDNGIKSHDAARRAAELGIGLIVTDHHVIEEDLPEADAVINPRRDDPDAAYADLSGAAVAFKLSSALNGMAIGHDLAALGLVADIVPLRRENRTLVALGLREMSTNATPGLAALAKRAGLDITELKAENIAFQLGPRLNACGRIGDGQTSLSLLMTECPREAATLAEALHIANEERRCIERLIYEDAETRLSENFDPEDRSIVLSGEGWHPGVVGIVAAKLQWLYSRPVVLIAINGQGLGRGSARSTGDFDIMLGMNAGGHLLEKFGGHRAAAGLTIQKEHIEEFSRIFEETARAHIPSGDRALDLCIDAQVALTEIDGQLLDRLNQLEPYGAGNPAPVFCACGVEVEPGSARVLRGGHLRLSIRDGRAKYTCIGFGMADRIGAITAAGTLDIAFTPKFNTWRGETSIQLELRDVRAAATVG